MDKRVKIAIIDNGIDNLSLNRSLENNIFIDSKGKCVADTKSITQQKFQHGTNCARIIEKNFKECRLTSIRILDDDGRGGIGSLEPALEWCYENGVVLVNLSLGTTHFSDKNNIRKIVNKYINRGMIIIAASANSGYTSYPASFSNVIGVVAGEKLRVNKILNLQQGIDFEAPCNYKVENEYGCFPLVKSNSYAAPYITALAGKSVLQNKITKNYDIKRKICNMFCLEKEEYDISYIPDWITSAWSDYACNSSMAEPYFDIYTGDYKQYEESIDTIIFKDAHKIKQYNNREKNLLYLGKEAFDIEDFKGFYWNWEKRIEQIRGVEGRKENLQLPTVLCVLDEKVDLLWLIIELKNRFCKEGYNIYAISTKVESVLYDLEYIPKEIVCADKEKLHDFLYWQTYYQQSDALLWGTYFSEAGNLMNTIEDVDMGVSIKWLDESYFIVIKCDGIVRKQNYAKQIDCNILFEDILSLLTEEDNGQ